MKTNEKDIKEDNFITAPPGIDVKNIMTEIKSRIAAKQKNGTYLKGDDVVQLEEIENKLKDVGDLSKKLIRLHSLSSLDLEGDPIVSHRKVWGPVIKFFKKTTRFWTRKYTDPIFFKQNNLNVNIVDCLMDLSIRLNQIEKEINILKHTVMKNEKE